MALAGACARQGIPPGGPEDVRPPVVVSTTPDAFEVVGDEFGGRVRFVFDERISERAAGGTLSDAVVVSPATGAVRVDHGRRSLEVSVAGGFLPGLVYRVTLQPVVSDLFNNVMRDPFEIVFSTGPEPEPTTIAGIAWDRITGRSAPDYRVTAVRTNPETGVEDSVVHVARTDTGGVYAFRYVPGGRYTLTAFEDRNRNAAVDANEPQGIFRALLGPGDTIFAADIAILTPDTTPARVTSVTVLDSVTLLVQFDDYLDPGMPMAAVGVDMTLVEDTTLRLDMAAEVMHAHEYVAFAEAVADSFAVLDSIDDAARQREPDPAPPAEPDSATSAEPDSALEAAPEPVVTRRTAPVGLDGRPTQRRRPPPPGQVVRVLAGPNGERLPSQQIVLILSEPLVPNQGYRVAVTAVRSIAAVPLGGGSAVVVLEPPSQPPTEAPAVDSPALDALGVDTATVVDTASVIDTATVMDTLWMPGRHP